MAENKNIDAVQIVGGVFGIIVLWSLAGFIVAKSLPGPNDVGQFGDMFGSINALFSGLAFAGVVFAIILQRSELRLQWKELILTRTEFEKQTEHFRQQVEEMTLSTRQESFVKLIARYESAEMLNAIRSLWQFGRENKDDLTARYLDRLDAEAKQVDSAKYTDRVELERQTLHYKRRIISKFYVRVAALRELGALSDEMFFSYWQEPDLRIIPEILLPIESAIATRYGHAPGQNIRTVDRLRRIYDDAVDRSATR